MLSHGPGDVVQVEELFAGMDCASQRVNQTFQELLGKVSGVEAEPDIDEVRIMIDKKCPVMKELLLASVVGPWTEVAWRYEVEPLLKAAREALVATGLGKMVASVVQENKEIAIDELNKIRKSANGKTFLKAWGDFNQSEGLCDNVMKKAGWDLGCKQQLLKTMEFSAFIHDAKHSIGLLSAVQSATKPLKEGDARSDWIERSNEYYSKHELKVPGQVAALFAKVQG